MGQRGPTRATADVAALSGARAKRNRRAATAPGPLLDTPRPPAVISPAALEVWEHVVEVMGPSRTVKAADSDTLWLYCEAVAQLRRLVPEWAEASSTVEGRNRGDGQVRNPIFATVRDLMITARQYARELGLTPMARSGIDVPTAPPDPSDAARFLTGGS